MEGEVEAGFGDGHDGGRRTRGDGLVHGGVGGGEIGDPADEDGGQVVAEGLGDGFEVS